MVKKATPAAPVDVEAHGFRYPSPPPASGDDGFDEALAQLLAKCESAFKRGALPGKLPARLTKLKPGDDARVLAQLDPATVDLGACEFDYDRGADPTYMAAWRATRGQKIPREYQVAALAGVALALEGGEARVRELLEKNLSQWYFTQILIETVLASKHPISSETLEVGVRALETDGKATEIHMCWVAGARAAMRLPTATAIARLIPWLTTERAKAVLEGTGTGPLDAAWREPLAALGDNYVAGKLLARVT